MIRFGILFVLVASSVLWACQEPLDPASSVSKFRVLAVQAEPPDARPGEVVTHRALTADPKGKDEDGNARKISYLWLTCMGLMTPSTGASGCTVPLAVQFQVENGSDALNIDLQTNNVTTVPDASVYTVNVPSNALDQLPEGSSDMQATTIAALCAGGTVLDEEQLQSIMNAFSDTEADTSTDPSSMVQINLDELCKDGDGIVTFKTFRVSTDDANRNTNPEFIEYLTLPNVQAALYFNHKPLPPNDSLTGEPSDTTLSNADGSSKCGDSTDCIEEEISKPNTFTCDTLSKCLDGVDIDVYLTGKSFEFYDKEVLGEITKTDEAPYISWFADGGELSMDRSRTDEPPGPFSVTWSPPQEGGEFTLYVVAHDLRGGTNWQTYSIAAITSETK